MLDYIKISGVTKTEFDKMCEYRENSRLPFEVYYDGNNVGGDMTVNFNFCALSPSISLAAKKEILADIVFKVINGMEEPVCERHEN